LSNIHQVEQSAQVRPGFVVQGHRKELILLRLQLLHDRSEAIADDPDATGPEEVRRHGILVTVLSALQS
jgi:hypothetical protein